MTDIPPVPKACSRCGAEFGCGINLDECWCTQIPPLATSRLDINRDCLCPKCLAQAVDNQAPKITAKITK